MIYGYARISTAEQKLDRQTEELKNFGVSPKNIYTDKQSGSDFLRKSYIKMLKKLRQHDLLVIKSIDRLGRNYQAIIDQWHIITKKIKADIVVLDMPLLDTRDAGGNLIGRFISDIVLQILSFVAENERNMIRSRQAEGVAEPHVYSSTRHSAIF
ncbi:MAG TPA: recombinase family protein [Firmicutes bacterium]|nr:recombinase family protein [Bacillota bacterium]